MFAICLGRIEFRKLAEISGSRGAVKSPQWVLAIQSVTWFVTAGMGAAFIYQSWCYARFGTLLRTEQRNRIGVRACGGRKSKKRETLRLPRLTFGNCCTSVSYFSLNPPKR
jgi:hypothetical protein